MNNQAEATSRIDHILTLEAQPDLFNTAKVLKRCEAKTSPHDALSGEILLNFKDIKPTHNHSQRKSEENIENVIKQRIKWEHVDLERYEIETEGYVLLFNKAYEPGSTPEMQIDRLNEMLYNISVECINVL